MADNNGNVSQTPLQNPSNDAGAGASSEHQNTADDLKALQEQMRKIQSTKDAEVAAANRRAQELQAQFEALQEQNKTLLESIQDPQTRAKMLQKEEARRAEARERELQYLRYKEYLLSQGIPASYLSTATTPQELAEAERNYYTSRMRELEEEVKKKDNEVRVSKEDASGALDVQVAKAPSPEGTVAPGAKKSVLNEVLEEKKANGKNFNAGYEYLKRVGRLDQQKGTGSPKV